VNGDALAASDEAQERVRRRRLAAAREAGHQAVDADDEYSAACPFSLAAVGDHRFFGPGGKRFIGLACRVDGLLQRSRVDLRTRDRREKIVQLGNAGFVGDRFEIDRRHPRCSSRSTTNVRERWSPRAAAP
jgi:hypothetical protein